MCGLCWTEGETKRVQFEAMDPTDGVTRERVVAVCADCRELDETLIEVETTDA